MTGGHEPPPAAADVLSAHSRPIAIAHRSGNNQADLRCAQELGVDLIEVDLWLHRGRIEVRHARTLWPLPLLWDRGRPQRGWGRRRLLRHVLEGIQPETNLLLDLKGADTRLPDRLVESLAAERPGHPILVCSQSWELLDRLQDNPEVTIVLSIGTPEQLPSALRRLEREPYSGVSIERRLLTEDLVATLHRHVPTVVTWTVNSDEQLERVLALGVDGVISDEPQLLERVIRARGTKG